MYSLLNEDLAREAHRERQRALQPELTRGRASTASLRRGLNPLA